MRMYCTVLTLAGPAAQMNESHDETPVWRTSRRFRETGGQHTGKPGLARFQLFQSNLYQSLKFGILSREAVHWLPK